MYLPTALVRWELGKYMFHLERVLDAVASDGGKSSVDSVWVSSCKRHGDEMQHAVWFRSLDDKFGGHYTYERRNGKKQI